MDSHASPLPKSKADDQSLEDSTKPLQCYIKPPVPRHNLRIKQKEKENQGTITTEKNRDGKLWRELTELKFWI